jgi:hypothetical protein
MDDRRRTRDDGRERKDIRLEDQKLRKSEL